MSTPGQNPIEHLLAIREVVLNSGPEETAQYFDKFLHSYLVENKSLEVALDLKSTRGISSLRTQYQKARRNDCLRRAYALTDPALPDITRRETLLKQINHFENFVYHRWKKEGIPEPCSEMWFYLYRAKETGQKISLDARYLLYVMEGY